jgi:signal transduction histidine kinase
MLIRKSTQKELENQISHLKKQHTLLLKTNASKSKNDFEQKLEQSLKKERKLTAAILRESEKKYQNIFNSMTNLFQIFELVYDKDGIPTDAYYREVNPALERLTKKTREELIDKKVRDIFYFEDYWLEKYHEILTSGKSASFEEYGAEFDQYYKVTAWKVGENKIASIFTDFTEQKRVKSILKKAKQKGVEKVLNHHIELQKTKENKYEKLFDSMAEMVETIELIYDSKGKPIDFYIREANQSFANFLGKKKNEIIDKKASSIIGIIEDYWLTAFASVDKTGASIKFENYGVEFDKYYSVSVWKMSNNRVGVALTDITEKNRIKKYKSDIKLKLDKIVKDTNQTEKLANIGSWIFDPTTQEMAFSDEMFGIWAFDSNKGVPSYETIIKRIHNDDFELYTNAVNKAIKQGVSYNIEFRIYMPNGKPRTIKSICKSILDASNNIVTLQGISQDITQQKILEKELIKHERLKAIGEMSSSIAHDFNNSLQGMMGNLEIIRLQNDLSETSADRLNSIESSITDITGRINALQHFDDVKPHVKKDELINLNRLIEESLKESRPLWKDSMEKEGLKINITTNFKDIPKINCNRGELKSTLYNLIKNSIEAMPEGGNLIINTGIKKTSVFITFSDTGKGMNKETKLNIFEPFYSTKGNEIGRGLGMSGVYSIVKKHKGDIFVKSSEIGKGTTIEIIFPIERPSAIKDTHKNDAISEGKKSLRVLWVDDNDAIRENARLLLEFIGHSCDTVNSGEHALEHLNKNIYDIVCTDIGMPNMNGWELADTIRKTFGSKIKIVAVTGWDITEEIKNKHSVHFILQKPFTLEDLKNVFRVL